jgi:hypothetical protein
MPRAAEPRRPVPLRVQLDVAKRQLAELMQAKGFVVHRLELDHDPALGLRPIDPETGQHVPHQHEASCLVWRPDTVHRAKTTGRRGESDLSLTFNGDQSRIAKADRLEDSTEDFRRRLLAKQPGQPRERLGTIKGRGFGAKQKTPKRTAAELARMRGEL